MDIGVYTLTWADLFLPKKPTQVNAQAVWTETGVDALTTVLLKYDQDACAMLSTGINAWQKDTGVVWGEKGYIELPTFWRPDRAVLTTDHGTELMEHPLHKDCGFHIEIEHVHDCLDHGLLESPVITFEASCRVAELTDRIRREIGLHFPCEP